MTLHRTPGQRNRVRDGAVLANKKRVIKMLVIVVLLFSLSWLPYQVHLFRITLIKLLVFSSCFVLYTIFVSLCLKTNPMIMPSSLFHSCFSCIALSSLFFADLLHGGLDDAFHQPVQVHQPALSPLPLVCHWNSGLNISLKYRLAMSNSCVNPFIYSIYRWQGLCCVKKPHENGGIVGNLDIEDWDDSWTIFAAVNSAQSSSSDSHSGDDLDDNLKF